MTNRHWFQSFIENNLWQILLLGGGLIILYATIAGQVRANDDRLDKLETVLVSVTANQTQILLIQQRQDTNDSALKDIKSEMNKRFDTLENKIESL